MKFLVLVFISSIVISCSEEEKISTPVKPLNSQVTTKKDEKQIRREIIEAQMDLHQGIEPEKNKEKLALSYFRLSLLKKGSFKDHFINKAFEALGEERSEERLKYFLDLIKDKG